MTEIENRLFRYFVTLAEELHFGRAALRLGISGPTLTHQIKKLESELGARLLERRGNRKVVVTDAGQRVLVGARQALRHVEEIAAVALQAARGELGSLQLGFMISVFGAESMLSWIAAFQEAHPTIEIITHRLGPVAQIGRIARKELDAGFARALHKYPLGVRGFKIYSQPFVLALPSKHPLARHEAISPAMLADEAFVSIAPERDLGFSGYTEAVGRIGKFVPRVVKRHDDFIALLSYVALGNGIAVVPELMKTVKFSRVVYRDIAADPVPQTSIAFVYSSDPSPSAKLLIRHMQGHALRNGGRGAPLPTGNTSQKDSPKLVFRRVAS
jgi:DNA-binding transcriptional LysR family regulator